MDPDQVYNGTCERTVIAKIGKNLLLEIHKSEKFCCFLNQMEKKSLDFDLEGQKRNLRFRITMLV